MSMVRAHIEESSMNKFIARFVKDESGATAIEYGLIAAGISVAIVTIVFTLGSTIQGIFSGINTKI
jgi:pilus assembly protein Flp/PilA